MRKFKLKCLYGLMLLALSSASCLYATDYISAENFAEANGISHQWFPIQKMLIMRKGLNSIKFRVGESTAIANEKEIRLSGVPRIQNNSIYVPADSLQSVFAGSKSVPIVQINNVPINQERNQHNIQSTQRPIAVTPATPPTPMQTPPVIPPENMFQDNGSEATLIALRHSEREDHTRVVLEFNNPVTYKSDFKNGIYKVTISGCKNLIPTKRTNPVGRDIAKLDLNSGANREGLILTFTLNQKEKTPTIETVADPFRMIVELPLGTAIAQVATATVPIASPTIKIEGSEKPAPVSVVKPVEMEKPPEINIEVPIETVQNKEFLGRTVVIDPGHGGSDHGFEVSGRPPEKSINLDIARLLKQELEKAGFRAVLLRNDDITMSYRQRLTLANKCGGDLHIAIHTGGSNDTTKHGVACYIFTDKGISYNEDRKNNNILNYDDVFDEWLRNTRFDLSEYLAKKINNRLTKHLSTDSRGVIKSPLLPLKFIMNTAVLVEVGMLSDKVEGKNLISDIYKQAIAKSITNGVIDFFNGIKLN